VKREGHSKVQTLLKSVGPILKIRSNKYVSGDWPLSTHADPTSTRRAIFHERCGVTNWNIHCPLRSGQSSDLGLLGEQSSQKWEIPCPGRRWTAVQNVTPLVLSSAEKSVTVKTNKHTSS